MRLRIFTILFFVVFILFTPQTFAQTSTTNSASLNQSSNLEEQKQRSFESYYKAKVIEVVKQGKKTIYGVDYPYQVVLLKILDSQNIDEEVKINHGDSYRLRPDQFVKTGDTVIISKSTQGNKTFYLITDKYRLPNVAFITFFFLLLVVFFARRKGVGAIVGLVISFAILMIFIIPRIVAGDNPLIIILIGCIAISTITIFLAHGVSKRTTIAYISTVITLALSGIFAYSFIMIARLSGIGSDDAYTLQSGAFQNLNFQGLLLGGIMIGTLGVLDDITTAQSAVVDELKKANPKLTVSSLYERGLSVGQEHIASLVNTLILVYAGSAFPLLLAFTIINQYQPLWVTLNSQFIVEEIVRSLVGSVALVLAVPITTIIAAWYMGKKVKSSRKKSNTDQ